jgi:hypothetical protein
MIQGKLPRLNSEVWKREIFRLPAQQEGTRLPKRGTMTSTVAARRSDSPVDQIVEERLD